MAGMTECKRIEALLGPYFDGELAERERRQVEDELARCASCRAQLDQLHKLREALRGRYLEEAMRANLDGLLPAVMGKVREHRHTVWDRISDWLDEVKLGLASPAVPLGAAGALALAVVTATLIYSMQSGSEPQPRAGAVAVAPAEDGHAVALAGPGEADVTLAGGDEDVRRRPRHDEAPLGRNQCYITYYQVDSGIVIVDVDPDGETPTVVWHFADDAEQIEEGNRI